MCLSCLLFCSEEQRGQEENFHWNYLVYVTLFLLYRIFRMNFYTEFSLINHYYFKYHQDEHATFIHLVKLIIFPHFLSQNDLFIKMKRFYKYLRASTYYNPQKHFGKFINLITHYILSNFFIKTTPNDPKRFDTTHIKNIVN